MDDHQGIRDYVIQSLEETELREVADYLAYPEIPCPVRTPFRSPMTLLWPGSMVSLARNDNLADEGMADYEQGLRMEDAL